MCGEEEQQKPNGETRNSTSSSPGDVTESTRDVISLPRDMTTPRDDFTSPDIGEEEEEEFDEVTVCCCEVGTSANLDVSIEHDLLLVSGINGAHCLPEVIEYCT